MSRAGDSVGSLSGKRPAARVLALLDEWLLPGEPVMGAVAGTLRLMPVWFVLTESVILLVRDGMTAAVEQVIPLARITGWQSVPGWGSTKLAINTTDGMVTIDQVKDQHLVAFGHALEQVDHQLGRSGVPRVIDPIHEQMDEIFELIASLLENDLARAAVEEETPAGVLIGDFGRAFCIAFDDLSALNYGSALMLCELASLVDPDPSTPRFGRARWFARFMAQLEGDYYLLRAVDAVSATSGSQWDGLLSRMGDLIESSVSLLPSSPSAGHGSTLRQEADKFRSRITQPAIEIAPADPSPQPATAGPPLSQGGSILEQLERLQAIRESGALTEDEFETLKKSLLTA